MANRLHNKWQKITAQVTYLPQTLQLIWSASHYWTLAWGVLLLVQGLLPAATVSLSRVVVDSIVKSVGKGVAQSDIHALAMPILLMLLILVLTEVLQGVSEWVRTAQSELVQDHISQLVHQQSIAIDYSCYESSEFNDRLSRAREGASGRSLALLENVGSVLQSCITLIAMAAILLPYGIWLPLILAVSALPAFYASVRYAERQYRWSRKTTTDRRWLQYYDLLLTSSWVAAELRLFEFGSYFSGQYQTLRRQLRREQMKLIKDQGWIRFFAGTIALLIMGGAMVWMGYRVLLGTITLGDLMLFYQAFSKGQSIIESLLGSLGQAYKNSLFISNLFEFLQLQPEIVDPLRPCPVPAPLQKSIQFRQVTFTYPGEPQPVLENFNLTIPVGKVVAIVGDNGAGKSTLIKLLCRFYDPIAGKIEFDGIDIRDFAVKAFRRSLTVLFQNPTPYYTTAAQNIALGDLSIPESQVRVEQAARDAGIHAKISSFPEGYEARLGKWFPGGTDLSGGQWQRLALARAFFREAQLIILDEPTSAMDPWAEFDWLERFRHLAAGRTAVVITHRFTLAMRADVIHVMRAGKIVESGSHDDLLMMNGLYAQSWRSQMETPMNETLADVYP
jgi:ATP-binding cassette, subfamily B, bacterial